MVERFGLACAGGMYRPVNRVAVQRRSGSSITSGWSARCARQRVALTTTPRPGEQSDVAVGAQFSTAHGVTRLRFFSPSNPEYHEVVAEGYETERDVITLHGVTSFDGHADPPWPRGVVTEQGGTVLRTRIAGDVEVIG
jgi:hypothetical protein